MFRKNHPSSKPRLPLSKRIAFTTILCVMVITIAELFAWMALCTLEGRLVTYGSLAEERHQIIKSEGKEIIERNQGVPDDYLENRVVHPFLGYADGPEERVPVRGPDDQMDQYGFAGGAGPFIHTPKPDGVVVAIFGGSVTRLFLEMGGTEVLRRKLEASKEFAGKHIVIDDLGVFGFKQPQQLMALNYLLSLGAHFDVIVNLDGFNEVALAGPELIPQGVFPFYPARWFFRAAAIDADPRTRLLIGEIAYRRNRRARIADAFRHGHYSMIAQLLWKAYDRSAERSLGEEESSLQQLQSKGSNDYATQGPMTGYASDDELYLDLTSMWQRSAELMHDIAIENGAMFIEILQPNQYAPGGGKAMSAEERAIAWDEDQSYKPGAERGYPLLREAGEELTKKGISFHDLSLLFHSVTEPLFLDSCCHFNSRGNEILAEKMAEIIRSEKRRPKP